MNLIKRIILEQSFDLYLLFYFYEIDIYHSIKIKKKSLIIQFVDIITHIKLK